MKYIDIAMLQSTLICLRLEMSNPDYTYDRSWNDYAINACEEVLEIQK